jgi:hypothetical protein
LISSPSVTSVRRSTRSVSAIETIRFPDMTSRIADSTIARSVEVNATDEIIGESARGGQ